MVTASTSIMVEAATEDEAEIIADEMLSDPFYENPKKWELSEPNEIDIDRIVEL
jgi:hypothetical protein